jgi:F-type H+-transporting ATPase subunit epsilon
MSRDLPSTFQLKVITPGRLLVEAEVEEASLPSLDGLIGVLPGHRPLMIALGEGKLTYRQGAEGESFDVKGGQAEILPDRVLVFTELNQEND